VGGKPSDIARKGLEAWRRGEFETIEQLLDPQVEWHGFKPGEGDCRDRADVMRTLQERHEQGFAAGDVELRDAGDTVIVVSRLSEIGGPEWPAETAMVMTFRGDHIVSMQDYRSEADARATLRQA
jgi:ketosteroid isomerase-like protein